MKTYNVYTLVFLAILIGTNALNLKNKSGLTQPGCEFTAPTEDSPVKIDNTVEAIAEEAHEVGALLEPGGGREDGRATDDDDDGADQEQPDGRRIRPDAHTVLMECSWEWARCRA